MANILIVEDDETNVKLLQRLLTMKGYQFSVATNQKDAVEAARREMPDLILMDIQMPEEPGGKVSATAGIEAIRELKSDQQTSSVPIIATSAHDLPEQRNRFKEAGCDDIQSKPYTDFNELLETIERNLKGTSAP
ncbi:MAG: response regulator [Planctomycetaceae bacterium]|jgi:two-component system, cell cycle response regulator DivK|nr:response regulator [Planctomycetaceae bacterium]MDC0273682.1 response regulator [Planctomycetaceae bacterium]MDG2388197.1 response regulator [Planctomycetaceae bacterium]